VFVQQDLLSIRTNEPQVSATNLKQHCAIVVTMGLKQQDVIFNTLALFLYTKLILLSFSASSDLWTSKT
jgi:hypothetical protein